MSKEAEELVARILERERSASRIINNLIKKDEYEEAEVVIRKELEFSAGVEKITKIKDEGAHWLWSRLSLCLYERRRYKTALRYIKKALDLAPACPMVLWEYAGTLTALDLHDEALAVYKRLLQRGMRMADGPCGEGKRHTQGLLSDCRYRVAMCYENKGDNKSAIKWLKLHLRLRKDRGQNIYPKKLVVEALAKLQSKS